MELAYTPQQQAFRAEVRAWMEAHVPKEPLVTLERREGYDQHVLWERELASGNWGMVTWPEAYGGRGLDLAWLQDAFATQKPVELLYHPDARTVLIKDPRTGEFR